MYFINNFLSVLGTLPTWTACQSQSFLSEASEVLRVKCSEAPSTKTSEETLSVQVL